MTDDQTPDAEDDQDRPGGLLWPVIAPLGMLGNAFLAGLGGLSSVPLVNRPASKVWKGLTMAGLKNYHRSHGGDRTALEQFPNGKIKLTPVKWRPMELCDDNEQPGWKVKGRDKTYKPTTFGQTGPRLGRVPVLPLDNESWKATSYAEATVAEVIDQGDHRPLYDVSEAELTATIDARGNAGSLTGGTATADGGVDITEMRFNPRTSPIFKDMIVPLGGDDYDGHAISFWKAKELMSESSTTEEMAAQEERGFLAGRSRKDMKKFMMKVLLIGGLIAMAGLIGPELINALFNGGGGGGGGGGIIPF